jgi:tryptophan synthase alpha chain
LKKLVAYITSSLPNKNFTIDLILKLKEAGVDLIELGVPFSDPVADGVIIEKANQIALSNGFKINDIFEVSKEITKEIETLWMGYFNPFYHKGVEYFLQKAKELNVSGFIIPDLPYEEALAYKKLFNEYKINLIDFVAPTDTKERIEKITLNSTKFIYLVAYAGITGAGTKEDLTQIIKNIKNSTKTPIYIGFGVNEKTAKEKAKDVDGVIVGSTFVKELLREDLTSQEKIDKIYLLAKIIKEEINS